MKAIFYIDGKEPSPEIRDNPKCLIPVATWLMSSTYIQDDIAWVCDMCRHIGIEPELAPEVLSAGFANAYEIVELHKPKLKDDAVDLLVRAEASLFYLLGESGLANKGLGRMKPAVVLAAQQLMSTLQGSVLQTIMEHGILPLLPPDWLAGLAEHARCAFFSEKQADVLCVSQDLKQLISLMLPENLQRNATVEPLFVAAGEALAHRYGDSVDVWEEIVQSFIDSLEN